MDELQFKEKIVPLSGKLYSICFKILCDKEEAKDSLQDVLIKLWTQRNNLTGLKSMQAYAVTIARNICLDKLRVRKPKVDIESLNTMPHNDAEYETVTEATHRLQLIKDAIARLNAAQQKVFVLRDIERMEYDDIAHELQMSSENVRMTLSRARKKIRQVIELRIKQEKEQICQKTRTI